MSKSVERGFTLINYYQSSPRIKGHPRHISG